MVKADEIRDRDSVEAWLEGRPREDAVIIVARAALRRYPTAYVPEDQLLSAMAGLNCARGLLCAAVSIKNLSAPLTAALNAASRTDAARFVGRGLGSEGVLNALDAALGAADLAKCAAPEPGDVARIVDLAGRWESTTLTGPMGTDWVDFTFSFWEQVRKDARALEAGGDLWRRPLWSEPVPNWFREADAELRALWQADPAYDFWLRWWDGVLSGHQIDWALQEKVALIPDEVWRQGAEAVAAEIARIEEGDELPPSAEPASLGRTLERNRTAILLQFDALIAFVEGEMNLLRGQNSFSGADQGHRERRLELLRGIVDAVRLMREAIAEEVGEANALAVVEMQLPTVVTAADEAVQEGGAPGVSEIIATMAITIKHLTAAGTPGHLATGIAFADMCWRKIKGWRKSK